jgi:hypothetical protein
MKKIKIYHIRTETYYPNVIRKVFLPDMGDFEYGVNRLSYKNPPKSFEELMSEESPF